MKQPLPTKWRHVDLALLALLLLWAIWRFVSVCSGYWVYTVDDAYITLRQARNLVEGHGFVYNPGGPRVESYTNHLLFLWQALILYIGGDGLHWTKVLGTAAGVATLLGSAFLGFLVIHRLDRPDSRPIPFAGIAAAPLLLSQNPILFTGSVSGLETSLFTALITWAGTLSLLGLEEKPRRLPLVIAGVLFGLATWTRPEGIAWLVGFAVAMTGARAFLRFPLRPSIWIPAIGASFWLALTLWRLAIFGHPAPNTYYAKMGYPLLHRLSGGTDYIVDYMFANGGVWLFGAVALGFIGATARQRLALGITLAAAACGVLLAWYEGGDWIPYLRLMSPLIGLLAGAAAAGIIIAAAHIPKAGFALAVIAPFVFWQFHFRATMPATRRAAAEVQTRIFGWNDAHKPLGEWLGQWNARRESLGRGPLIVAIEDIGLVGWYGRVYIIDLAGLADPYWAHMHYRDATAKYPAGELLHDWKPDVVVIVSQSGRRAENLRVDWHTNRAIYEHPDFLPHYTEHAMFTHKGFANDGLYLHVFVRNDISKEAPPVTPPAPRAVD